MYFTSRLLCLQLSPFLYNAIMTKTSVKLKKQSKPAELNVAEQAIKFLAEMEKGFNDIPVGNIECECIWHKEYAIFLLDFEFDLDIPDNPYVTVDYAQFHYDLQKYMQEKYFPNCQINYSSGCHEWEIIGPNQKEFHKTHEQVLEDFSWKKEPDMRKKAGRYAPIIFDPTKKQSFFIKK